MHTLHSLSFASFAICALAGTAGAATLNVTNLNDSGSGSLRDTIAGASAGDTIQLQVTGIIPLTSGRALYRQEPDHHRAGPIAACHQRQSREPRVSDCLRRQCELVGFDH
jgi:hypothetical protein